MFKRIAKLVVFCALLACCREALADEPYFTLQGIPCPYYIETGDMNNDGKPDLIVSSMFRLAVGGEKYDNTRSRVYIFYQKNGTYKLPADKDISLITEKGQFLNPFGTKAADFDNDGKNDLAVVGSKRLYLFFGGEDLKVAHRSFNSNQSTRRERQVVIVKLNDQGIADMLVGPVWRKWLGAGKFQYGYFSGPVRNDNVDPVLADLDNDGAMDVIFSTIESPFIHIYYGPFPNMSVKPVDCSQFVRLTAPNVRAVADLNNDGRLDIIASGEGKVLIYYQNSPAGFTDKAGPSASIEGISGKIVSADLNGDGLSDLAVAAGKKIYLFEQKEGKPFAKSISDADSIIDTGSSIYKFKVTDINGDGLPDFIISTVGRTTGAIKGFLNKNKKKGELL